MNQAMRIRLVKHEAVQGCGSYELRFPDGRPSKLFYFEDLPGRRLRSDLVEAAAAERVAKIFARAEQHMLTAENKSSSDWGEAVKTLGAARLNRIQEPSLKSWRGRRGGDVRPDFNWR